MKKLKSKIKYKIATNSKYTFENRKKNFKNLCIILAGYKEFSYEVFFKRIEKFIENDIDVCIVSSGLYSNKLSEIARKNNWSYLSTKKNCVTIAQNIAIDLHKDAEFIYKLDEDIFITENYFSILKETYNNVLKDNNFNIGFIAPLIPINGYGYSVILNKLNLSKLYEKKFEYPKMAAGSEMMIESSFDVAKFMWGEDNIVPSIDELNANFSKSEFEYSVCPIRFSIGAILFTRETWLSMGYFKVAKGPCMGVDEAQFCEYCINTSHAIIVSNNCVVGHLGFGQQNKHMEEYYINVLSKKLDI